MSHRSQIAVLLLAAGWIFALAQPLGAAEAVAEFFEKRVRPVLVERCYECHGEKKQKGGLRLDGAAVVQKGGDSGAVLVAGQPEKSLLIKVISWSDPDLQMPPKNKLPDAEIAALTDWVKMGAPDPRTNQPSAISSSPSQPTNHWAYQPLKKSTPPVVKNAAWPRSDIDRFILAPLEAKQIQPVADADRATLLRRAYYDLIGLPPTPEQIDAFVNDKSPEAFAKVVDQLLASPQFGERWGRHWLDVARYAESVTLRGFIFKEAWRYRDYVIDAFNNALPFDQFIREQIAGDLLDSKSISEKRRRMIATTFLALGNTNLEEQDKAQLRMDIVDEQLDTIGKAFLAQTIGCARCHDHKFDPIPTRDYYAMAGILRNTKTVTNANVSGWLELPLPVEAEQEKVFAEHEKQVAALQAEIKKAKDVAKALAGKSSEPKAGRDFQPTVVLASALPGLVVDSSQAKPVGDWKHSQFSKHYIGDGYVHDDLKGKGEKTLTFQPDLKKGRYEVRFAYQHGGSRATNVPVTVFHADGETTIHVNQQEAPVLDGRFVSLGQFRFEGNGFGYALVSNEGTQGHVTADAVQFLPAEMAEVTATSDAKKSPVKKDAVNSSAELKALEAKLKQLNESGPKRPLVMSVREEEKIDDTYVHVRGSVHNVGAKVPRGFLQVATLGAPPIVPEKQSGRREFADWIASPSNPLTARVMVNRTWHWLFGAGLVRSTDNFGTTGETPSHPELLDHLASQFIAQGWSVKKLVREIMLSRAYQLASATSNPKSVSVADPENRLFAHANRRRLDAEAIRDTMLFVSGQLSAERGGPSFKPALSADYGFSYTEARRSVYVPAFRNALPEIFEAFDFADPSMVVGVRNVSTVAPQALFLMNHPFVREQAQVAAKRLLAEKLPDDDVRLRQACRLALGRGPTAGEMSIAQKVLQNADSAFEAWTDVFHALFASPDFRYVN
jgi:mono/diheme cytochrome c family protein